MPTTDRRDLFDKMASDLYVAVISDILDSLGFRDQVLESNIQPIDPLDRRVLVGTAHTLLMAPIYEMKREPYTRIIAAIDALQPGNVGVVATSGLASAAYWGELFSNAALGRGARGMLLDGYHRDTRKILDLGFPVFSTGARPSTPLAEPSASISTPGRLQESRSTRATSCSPKSTESRSFRQRLRTNASLGHRESRN
ncbi:MAG: RraA family protein [Thermomicrobiales bacterium]